MRTLIVCVLLSFTVLCCKSKTDNYPDAVDDIKPFRRVIIEDILVDSTLNVRALEVEKGRGSAAFATSDGRVGLILKEVPRSSDATIAVLQPYFMDINFDSIYNYTPNFRSLALTNQSLFVLSIESPAYLYKITYRDSVHLVYQEHYEKAFYDSMEFFDDQIGIAMGDPTDGCLSILRTADGGNTWTKLDCDQLPPAKEGEAAFAASDSNIVIKENNVWIATGGKASRVWFSDDMGLSWDVFETPIIQGKETTGAYSIDFYDNANGFAVGGDYIDPKANFKNKIRTTDGGRTWKIVSDSTGIGYRSCVQYVPNSKAMQLVAIGFEGIDYTADAGETWFNLSEEGFYTFRFINENEAIAAGKGRISKLIFKKD